MKQEIAACKEWMFIIADRVCSNKWRGRKKGLPKTGKRSTKKPYSWLARPLGLAKT